MFHVKQISYFFNFIVYSFYIAIHLAIFAANEKRSFLFIV